MDSQKKEDDRIFEMYLEIGRAERHFNDLQSTYRRIASLWLLATLSAIGLAMAHSPSLGLNQYFVSAVISILGIIGISLLWSMDLLVYHRLLDSYFLEGVVLERRHLDLPPIRHNMMSSQDGTGKGVLVRVVNFYKIPINVLIVACATFVYCYSQTTDDLPHIDVIQGEGRWPLAALTAVSAIVAMFAFSRRIEKRTMNPKLFDARLKNIPPPPGYEA